MKIAENDYPEFAGQIIDMLEDWLEEKGVKPDMLPNDREDDENAAIIFGEDYDLISETIRDEADKYNLISHGNDDSDEEKTLSVKEKADIANNIFKSMAEVINKIKGFSVTNEEAEEIKENVILDTFRNWEQ